MKITQFKKETVSSLAQEINEALKAIAQKYQIEIKTNGGNFDPERATLKLELQTITDSGIAITKEASAFKQLATVLNLKAEDLFKEFTINNEKYIFMGYATRSSRFSMICKKVSNQKQYGLPLESVVKSLNNQRSA